MMNQPPQQMPYQPLYGSQTMDMMYRDPILEQNDRIFEQQLQQRQQQQRQYAPQMNGIQDLPPAIQMLLQHRMAQPIEAGPRAGAAPALQQLLSMFGMGQGGMA